MDKAGDASVFPLHRFRVELVVAVLLLTATSMCRAAGGDATVSGVVRDAQGVGQMGALVQVLGVGAALVGTAYTDLNGHYAVGNLLPGRYQVKASAPLFTPSTRSDLRLPLGARAVVDLTLSTLFQPTAWLPAEKRRADEPSDDWKWTLRSAANRPILRLLDEEDEDGNVVMVSSSATEASKAVQHATGTVSSGDGGFGLGGVHHRLVVDEVMEDGSAVMLRADLGSDLTQPGRAPSTDFDAGYERRLGFGGASRTVVSYQSHPEMRSTDGTAGVSAMRLASAERTKIADVIDLEYGSSLSVIHVADTALAARPFVRIVVHPSANWQVGYRMATSRELQAYDALDSLEGEMPVAMMTKGRLATEQGRHQEIELARTDGRGLVQVAFYRDGFEHALISGTGIISADDLQRPGVQGLLVDTTTDNFRLLSGAYGARGVRLTISEPLTQSLSAAFSVASGEALTTRGSGAETLEEASDSLRSRSGESATVAIKGRIVHTGTKVRAAYRWQPRSMVTAIDSYAAFSDQEYFSFYLSQPIRFGRVLPSGLNATIDVTNLLGQGYQPFLAKDGRTVFLAQSPRALQAGLSYTF